MRAAWVCLLVLGCASRANEARPADAAPRSGASGAARPDAGDDTDGCATDADCALTRVAAGACCPMLCAPRPVTRKRAEALEDAIASCNGGRGCPEPICRPPVREVVAGCVASRCVTKDAVPPN